MKKVRGIRLILLGVLLAMPCFVWIQISDKIPAWIFYTSAIVFSICMIVGLVQIAAEKDVILDADLSREMKEKREKSAKRGLSRFIGI